MTTPDRRFERYARWVDELGGYPADIPDKGAHEVAVKFLYCLDAAVCLITDSQLDRLLRFLQYLDEQGGFFSPAATSRLATLSALDFPGVLARPIAFAIDDTSAGFDEMAEVWRTALCFERSPDEVRRRELLPRSKPYRGLLIDRELDDVRMDRLNEIPGVTITSTCAGHPGAASGPQFVYRIGGDDWGTIVESDLVNTGKNQEELDHWWEELDHWWDEEIHRVEKRMLRLGSTGLKAP